MLPMNRFHSASSESADFSHLAWRGSGVRARSGAVAGPAAPARAPPPRAARTRRAVVDEPVLVMAITRRPATARSSSPVRAGNRGSTVCRRSGCLGKRLVDQHAAVGNALPTIVGRSAPEVVGHDHRVETPAGQRPGRRLDVRDDDPAAIPASLASAAASRSSAVTAPRVAASQVRGARRRRRRRARVRPRARAPTSAAPRPRDRGRRAARQKQAQSRWPARPRAGRRYCANTAQSSATSAAATAARAPRTLPLHADAAKAGRSIGARAPAGSPGPRTRPARRRSTTRRRCRASYSRPPSQTPRKLPTWCDRNTKPPSIDRYCTPKICATVAFVSGTVEPASPSPPRRRRRSRATAAAR